MFSFVLEPYTFHACYIHFDFSQNIFKISLYFIIFIYHFTDAYSAYL